MGVAAVEALALSVVVLEVLPVGVGVGVAVGVAAVEAFGTLLPVQETILESNGNPFFLFTV